MYCCSCSSYYVHSVLKQSFKKIHKYWHKFLKNYNIYTDMKWNDRKHWVISIGFCLILYSNVISMIFQSQQVEPDDLPHILWQWKNCTSFQNLTQSDAARRVDDFFSRIRNQVPSPPPGARNERKLLPFPLLVGIFQLRIFCEVWCEKNIQVLFFETLNDPFRLVS